MNRSSRRATPKARPSAWWWAGAILALGALLVVTLFLDTSIELTPDHGDAIAGIALCVGLAGGTVAAAAVLVFQPQASGTPGLAAVALGSGIALLLFLDTMGVGQAIAIHRDFATGPLERTQGTIRIGDAHVTHGKGSHYHVRLVPYGTDLTVSHSDYEAAFGTREQVRPHDRCVSLPLERAGVALRIRHGSMTAMPDGTIVPCPPARDR